MPSYFDWPGSPNRFIRFDTVRSADANGALDEVSAGFAAAQADNARAIKLPASPTPSDQVINLSAPARAGKLVGFDAAGNASAVDPSDAFWLGAFAANPTLNNQGGALVTGNLYYNSTAREVRVYDAVLAAWAVAYLPGAAYALLAIPQNIQSAAYTLVLADSGKQIFHPSADTTPRTWTIPANASVAFPIGTSLTFINQNGAGTLTIAVTTDTMRLAGAGTTGSRTLGANGIATAIKVTAAEWLITGTGLS